MSQMTFCVIDAERAVHARRHASFVDVLIPALSDDPETIEELTRATQRFLPPEQEAEPLARWAAGECDEPFDAGICLVDLPARLIVYQSTYCEFLRAGRVSFDDPHERGPETARWIPYHLCDEWLVTDQLAGWRGRAGERRRERQAHAPLDTRTVLYGKVIDFIVEECLAARGGSVHADGFWSPPRGWQWRELPERAAEGRSPSVQDAVAEIHARWLMTPRDELRGQTPRQVLFAHRAHIDWQVEDRKMQWSHFDRCPPPLWRESRAYRYAGYGLHEMIVYYELVRYLVGECWEMLVAPPAGQEPPSKAAANERLAALMQDWLHTPNYEDFSGRTPAWIIERERLRLPVAVSPEEAIIDDDCPLCHAMADMGPMFWHLDGCNMDDEFPFDPFCSTREQWEEEQRKWAELDEKLKREGRAGEAAAEDGDWAGPDDEPVGPFSPVWQHSFGYSRPSDPPQLTLFGIGAHLAELIVDLRGEPASQHWIETLNRDFGNLREAAADPAGPLVEPVVARFSEHLAAVGQSRPDLSAKCRDLDRQLSDFVHRFTSEPAADDDLPF